MNKQYISGHDLTLYFPDIREPDMKELRKSEYAIKQKNSPYYLYELSIIKKQFKQAIEIPPTLIKPLPQILR